MSKSINIFDFKILLCLLSVVLLGEAHHFFDTSELHGDWILFKSIGDTHITWYVYQNAEIIQKIVLLYVIYKFIKTRKSEILGFVCLALLVCSIIDLPLYWLNYKTSYYGLVYLVSIPITYYLR